MWQARGSRLWWGIGALGATVWACETARNPGGIQRDLIAPTISLSASQDTQQIASGLSLTVAAGDNLGLKDISLTYTGGYLAQSDTTFNTTVTSVSIPVIVSSATLGSGAGGFITIIGRATDGAGNSSADTLVIFLSNVQALSVTLLAPATGALASQGKGIPVSVRAQQIGGIQRIGFIVTPRSSVVDSTPLPINSKDSVIFTTSLPADTTYTDTLVVLASIGTFDVTGFAVDAGGRRGFSSTVTVTVQSVANDVTPPVVSHTIASRIEANDSITVHATDPSGIFSIGFRVDTALTAVPPFTGVVPLKFRADTIGGNLTDVLRTLSLGLAQLISTFPKTVVVRGYACDLALPVHNCAYSQTSTVITSAARRVAARAATPSAGVDTVVIVAGTTISLPLGGKIADAIYSANRNELYLTNIDLSRVEVFQVANTAFVAAGIPTAGPQPWGIALWPRDTLGAYGDSIVVADAGGTELSIIDVAARRLRWRQDLPDYLIQTYKVVITPAPKVIITEYNISDRPQYVGTVCRPNSGGATLCSPDSIFALYSTSPLPTNPAPFNNRATVRMEKLHRPAFTGDTTGLLSHFFWELAARSAGQTTDTLRIVMRRGLPYNQTQVQLSACAGVNVLLDEFALGDSTYVRNSGNFTHAMVGEGGTTPLTSARVMLYTAKQALLRQPDPAPCATGGPITDSGSVDVDFGMSPGIDVVDFTSNTGIKIKSIAINFNGGTNLARADSLYFLDEGLRLKGTSCPETVPGSGCLPGPGMDMNYNHAFAAGEGGTPGTGGTADSTNRVVFVARSDGNIDVFDTFFYNSIGTIPVRDPIIGPLRVAKDPGGNQLLFGVTAKGLVMVKLPILPNPNPAPPRR